MGKRAPTQITRIELTGQAGEGSAKGYDFSELAIRRLQRPGFQRALAVLDDASGPEVVPSANEVDKRQGAAMLR